MFESEPVRKLTQKDIARRLGVSIATVSLGLRNSSEISPARCRQIQEAAAEWGYTPFAAAAELVRLRHRAAGKSIVSELAWINAWQPPEALRSYRHFDACWNGASSAAQNLGYQLEEFRLGPDLKPARLHRILMARGIRGIMLPPTRHQPDWEDFPWERYSVMRFGRSLREPACHIVNSDQVSNAVRAFERMTQLGYQRIGFLTNEEENLRRGGHLFEAGVLVAQRFIDPANRVPICAITRAPDSGRCQRIADWVRNFRIDAVFTDVAEAPAWLRNAGLRIPDDVALSVTNVADIDVTAGIDQRPLEIGRVGTLMLHSLVTHQECGIPEIPRQVLVDGIWVDGPTLPPRR